MNDDNDDILPVFIKGKPLRFAANMRANVEAQSVSMPAGLILVTAKSPKAHHVATETMARCFMREMNYDFPQFTAHEYSGSEYVTQATDDKVRSFLWFDTVEGEPGRWPAIGGCTLRLKGQPSPYWSLEWVWIRPENRRQGHFRRAWPFLRSMFGLLLPLEPLSSAMKRFLNSVGYPDELAAHYNFPADFGVEENDESPTR